MNCPLDLDRIVDEYFAENRNHLLELAAFFDRVDRARDSSDPRGDPDLDFRVAALKQAAHTLLEPGPQRVKRIALALSDLTDEPRAELDRKAAWGAYAANGKGKA